MEKEERGLGEARRGALSSGAAGCGGIILTMELTIDFCFNLSFSRAKSSPIVCSRDPSLYSSLFYEMLTMRK